MFKQDEKLEHLEDYWLIVFTGQQPISVCHEILLLGFVGGDILLCAVHASSMELVNHSKFAVSFEFVDLHIIGNGS